MGLPEIVTPKEEKTRKRPARLDLAGTKSIPGGAASGGLGTGGPITALKTPKELAHDIALQCVSPAIPTFMNTDKVKLSKSIEAQQRKIIAQRSQAASDHPLSASLPRSANSERRAPRPKDLEIYPPDIPIHQSPPYTSTLTPRTNRTTIYLHSDGGRRYFSSGVQSARPQNASPTWGFIRGHARSRSTEATVHGGPGEQVESNEDDDNGDPEDAALSDDEPAQKAISPEDETAAAKHKRTNPYGSNDHYGRGGDGQGARRRHDKKMRFMSLCSEIWDLFHEPDA
jgi:hypothetical protein